MSKSLHRKTGFYTLAFFAVLALVITFGFHHANANTAINMAVPDDPSIVQALNQEDEGANAHELSSLLVVPLLIPPSKEMYTAVSLEENIQTPDSRPVAMLATNEDKIKDIAVYFPELSDSAGQEQVSFQILASFLYGMDGFDLIVSTSRPSSATTSYSLGLGNSPIMLRNGAEGWLITDIASKDTPNRIVFIEDDLIITVTGNAPLDQLEEAAGLVTVER